MGPHSRGEEILGEVERGKSAPSRSSEMEGSREEFEVEAKLQERMQGARNG